MKNLQQLASTALAGLQASEKYLCEDLDAICDDTMRDYVQEALEQVCIGLQALEQLNALLVVPSETKFKVSYVLGTEAVREYSNCVDNGEKWSISSLCDCGSVAHGAFATQAELDAYKQGIEDATGWLESEVMMTDDEWQQYLDKYHSDKDDE